MALREPLDGHFTTTDGPVADAMAFSNVQFRADACDGDNAKAPGPRLRW